MSGGEIEARRAYRSPLRAERARHTRLRVLEAATAVFLGRGYAGATMRSIAAGAGVSVPTVEQLFGTKSRILKAAIDDAIAGDDEPVPVLDRSWASAASAAGTAEEFLAIAAGVITAAQERSAALVLAVFEGARTDPDLARLAEQMTAQRSATAAWAVDALAAIAPLHADIDRRAAAESLWILMDPAVYDRLTRQRGWSPSRYGSWFARSARLLLIAEPTPEENTMTPTHGRIDYLQLPAADVARSAAFYEAVFGWSVDAGNAGFTAPGMIGQWTTDRPPSATAGPLLWICAENLSPTLDRVTDHGGTVHGRPQLDGGERWLVEIDDPAGNRVGVVVPVRHAQPQTMIAVRDVEASSRWYQQLLGLRGDHGGPEYERLLAGDVLVLQLHHQDVEHHHGLIADPGGDRGNGVLLWFGEVPDFDDVVARAEKLQAPVTRPPHRNPPGGDGNGPGHREIWISDPDGYTVVVASPDGEAYEPAGGR